MSLFKNQSGQKVRVFAFDSVTGLPKTGDAANITASVSKDFGAFADLADTSATEEDSTKAKGYYLFDISQTETNADDIGIGGRSTTSGIVVVGAPARMATRPPNAGALSIDSSGRVDVIKVNGTSQTARDIGASVLLSSGTGTGQLDFTNGVVKANATQWLGGTIPAVNVTGVPLVDLKYTLGTISPATAGYIGVDWGQITNKTTANALTSTTISTSQVVASVSGAVGSVTGTVGSVTGNVGGNVVGSVGSVAGAVGSVTAAVTLSAGDSPTFYTGTATAGAASTLTDSGQTWTVNALAGCRVKITSGTGTKQSRVIISNTATVLTVDRNWTTNPDATSVYAVVENDSPKTDSSLSVTAGTVSDKTGYSLSQSFPANFSSLAITAGGLVSADVQTINTQTVTCAAGVTVGAFVGNTTAALAVTAAGGVTLADGVAHGGVPGSSTATLALRSETVVNPAGNAVTHGSDGGGYGELIYGNGIYDGVLVQGGAGDGAGGWGGHAMNLVGQSGGSGLVVTCASGHGDPNYGPGMRIQGQGGNNPDLLLEGSGVFDFRFVAAALAQFFITDTTQVYAGAVSGSVVKEIVSNASTLAAADVWAAGTRTLTSGANIVLAKGTGVTGFNDPTAAAVATAVWTDTTAGDFTTATSPGKIIFTQLGGAFTTTSSSVFTVAALANAPSGTGASAATIATAVWTDLLTSSDFSTVGSIGKLLARLAVSSAGGVTLADGVAHGGTPGSSTATLALHHVNITNTPGSDFSGVAVEILAAGCALEAISLGSGPVVNISQGGSAPIPGVQIVGGGPAFLCLNYGVPSSIDSSQGGAGDVAALTFVPSGTAPAIDAPTMLDSIQVESGLNARQALSIITASCGGVLDGATTNTITIKGGGVATTRIIATVTADGDRTAVVLSPPA